MTPQKRSRQFDQPGFARDFKSGKSVRFIGTYALAVRKCCTAASQPSVSKVGHTMNAHGSRMEFSTKSERRFGRGFAVEYDPFRIRIEGGSALDLFGEMELDARFFLLGSLEKAQASQVECHAAR